MNSSNNSAVANVLANNAILSALRDHKSLIAQANESFAASRKANLEHGRAKAEAKKIIDAGMKKLNAANALHLATVKTAYALPAVKEALAAFNGKPKLEAERKSLCEQIEEAALQDVVGEISLLKSEAQDLKEQAELCMLDADQSALDGDTFAKEGRTLFDEANALAEQFGFERPVNK